MIDTKGNKSMPRSKKLTKWVDTTNELKKVTAKEKAAKKAVTKETRFIKLTPWMHNGNQVWWDITGLHGDNFSMSERDLLTLQEHLNDLWPPK